MILIHTLADTKLLLDSLECMDFFIAIKESMHDKKIRLSVNFMI